MHAPYGPSDSSPSRRLVLIVEDDRDNADVLWRLCARDGHEVRLASTLADARRLCDEHRFDVILCDIGLPDGSGLELAPLVRTKHPRTRLVALSGFAMPRDIDAGESAGFDAYLIKPVTAESLLRHLS